MAPFYLKKFWHYAKVIFVCSDIFIERLWEEYVCPFKKQNMKGGF